MFSKLRNRPTLQRLTGAAFMTLALGVQAETVEIPVGSQGQQLGEIAELRGLKQGDISARLGEPISIQGPVGEPAISRWEYADFYVYFEWDLVLHTVQKHSG